MMNNLALIICLISLAVWLICFLSDRFPDVKDLAKYMAAASLLAFLLK